MTDTTVYDGTGRLHDAIATLYGLSTKSKTRIAAKIKEAKNGLGIGLSDALSDTSRLAIWQWHYDRLNPGSNTVDVISQPIDVEINSQYPIYAHVRIAFYTTSNGIKMRQVIALDGFYVNALMSAIGITKSAVPAWVQKSVDSYADFDSTLPITKQVKYLLIRAIATKAK